MDGWRDVPSLSTASPFVHLSVEKRSHRHTWVECEHTLQKEKREPRRCFTETQEGAANPTDKKSFFSTLPMSVEVLVFSLSVVVLFHSQFATQHYFSRTTHPCVNAAFE